MSDRNHVIEEGGPLGNAARVRVQLFDGTLLSCRASLSFQGQTQAELGDWFSDSGRTAWISEWAVSDPTEIEFLIWPTGEACRVLHRDARGSAVRLQLREPA